MSDALWAVDRILGAGDDARMRSPEMAITECLKAFPEVERVILFGSRARGDDGFRADIDIAVECPTADTLRWSDIEEAVELAPTLLNIDLVRLDTAPPELLAAIRDEGRVLYERANAVRRVEQFERALTRLSEAFAVPMDAPLALDGTIQRFEFTFELCWKAIKAVLELQIAGTTLGTARAVIKAAYAAGWIDDKPGWIELLDMRNASSHIYNETAARDIYHRIKLRLPLMERAGAALRKQLV